MLTAFKAKFPDAAAWIVARLAEKSTVAGLLAALANVLGVVVAPDRADAIATITAGLCSLYLVVVREQTPPPPAA